MAKYVLVRIEDEDRNVLLVVLALYTAGITPNALFMCSGRTAARYYTAQKDAKGNIGRRNIESLPCRTSQHARATIHPWVCGNVGDGCASYRVDRKDFK